MLLASNMTQVDDLQKNVQQILDSMRTFVEKSCDLSWKLSDGFLVLVLRSILRRQFDSLEVISHLVKEGKGFAAGPLLRPACEELIWMKYLISIPSDAAEELIICIGNDEISKSLRAQDKFAGRSVTKTLGLLPYLKKIESRNTHIRKKMRVLGKRMNWPKYNIQNSQFPRISWLAKKTKQLDTYNFIYHATSRFVHFSVVELSRRAWGNPYTKSMSIGSTHFRNYWDMASLYWGFTLFLDTAIEFSQFVDVSADIDQVKIMEAAERIGRIGKPRSSQQRNCVGPSDC